MADPIVERERELAELQVHAEDAAAGDGRIVLIEGPAGIGKSRLLVETRRRCEESGTTTLLARASELEREFPFGVVRQLFEATLADPATRETALGGAAAPAQAVFASLQEASASDGSIDASFAVLHGLFWMTLNLASERPLALAVDDVQWSDRSSLRYLTYLARRLEGLPVLVTATLRTGEPATDEGMLADLSQDPATVWVRPGPLSLRGVQALARERLDEEAEDAFSAAVHDTTGGNPLLARQLLTALAAERVAPLAENAPVVREIGPRAVSRSVLLRLARMSSETIAVARAVAVLGENAELPAIAALADLADTAAAGAIATLARAEILRPEAPLGFVHPLVRDAVYHELPPGQRELQHARAARILADSGADPAQVATHLLGMPRRGDAWAVDVLRDAARSASRRGAVDNAVSYLQRALDEPPPSDQRPALLFELGVAESLTNGSAAAEHLYDAYEATTDPALRAQIAYVLSRALTFTRSPDEGAAFARRATVDVGAGFEDTQRSLLAVETMAYYFGVGGEDAVTELERFRTHDVPPGPGSRMLQSMAALDWLSTGGPHEQAAALAREALTADNRALIEADNGLFTIPAYITLTYTDQPDVLAVWDIALEDAHRRGSLFGLSACEAWRAFTLLYMGELAESVENHDRAYKALRSYGHGDATVVYMTSFHARALVEMGEVREARRVFEQIGDMPGRGDGPRYQAWARTELLLAEGRADEALAACDEFARRIQPRLVAPSLAAVNSQRARALAALGRREEGIPLVEDELARARASGAPGAIGRALRVLGELKGDAGVDDLRESVSVLERSLMRLERAKALASLGATLRRNREPTEAREPLREALELADACGAKPVVEFARTELYATGARPRTEAASGVGALTASERRVAGLAAEGNSNRDIAQALFVTPKTVEVHLSNAYRKLGIRSRRELPAELVG